MNTTVAPWTFEGVTIFLHRKMLTVQTRQWQMTAESTIAHPHAYTLRLNVRAKALYNVCAFPVAPHGILGQTFDCDGQAIHGRRDTYDILDNGQPTTSRKGVGGVVTTRAEAEGALEGGLTAEYMVNSPFDTRFAFSRFDVTRAAPRNGNGLTGRRTIYRRRRLTAECVCDGSPAAPAAPTQPPPTPPPPTPPPLTPPPSLPVQYGTLSSDLATNTISGSRRTIQTSLSYSTTPVLNAPVLFTYEMHPAGTFTDADSFSASMNITFGRITSDCDLMIAIVIGTDVFMVNAQDNGSGEYVFMWGNYTSGETHATRPTSNRQTIVSDPGKTEPETVGLTWSWPSSSGEGTVIISLANGFQKTHTMVGAGRPTFSSAVSGMLLADSPAEKYEIHSLMYDGSTFTGAQMG